MKKKKKTVSKNAGKSPSGKKSPAAKPAKKGKLVVDLNPNFVVTPL